MPEQETKVKDWRQHATESRDAQHFGDVRGDWNEFSIEMERRDFRKTNCIRKCPDPHGEEVLESRFFARLAGSERRIERRSK
jgi:hypothetical protein